MDISRHAVGAEGIDALSAYQIKPFFRRHESITKDDCDHMAAKLTGGLVSPTLVQGQTSYTVVTDASEQPQVVQFRQSALIVDLMSQARQTYGKFVPSCEPCGELAGVYVYHMDFIPGVAFSRARRQLLAPEMEQRLLRTVQDFAIFFASAWINRPASKQLPDNTRKLFDHYSSNISRLSQVLPERFQSKLAEIRLGLPLLFRPGYPIVLNHDDLLEMNIHVDKATGCITGIADWADAKLAPFGTSLGGLETILGVETSTRWLFHPSHKDLRVQFWRTFYGAVGHVSDIDRRRITLEGHSASSELMVLIVDQRRITQCLWKRKIRDLRVLRHSAWFKSIHTLRVNTWARARHPAVGGKGGCRYTW